MTRACVVVPTRNESASIGRVIADIKASFSGTTVKDVVVVVVDDSTDDTRNIARKAGAVVVRGGADGLGSAMYRGLKASLNFNPDVIIAVDGDGQADCEEIKRFLAPIESGEADMVLGSRFLQKDLVKYHYKFINRFGTIILSNILRSQTGLPLTDSHGGIRAMVPDVVRDLEMLGTHTYVQETIIDAAQKGYRIKEIPSVWKVREAGKSRVVGSIPKYIFYTLPILILRSGQHIRMLYSAGLALLASSMLLFFAVVIQEGYTLKIGHRTPALILVALLVLMGSQAFFFGFVLQLLKQIKKNVDMNHSLDGKAFSHSIMNHDVPLSFKGNGASLKHEAYASNGSHTQLGENS